MDMKNTVILLILLLSILGLVIGVQCTADENGDVSQNSEKISHESTNQSTVLHLEQTTSNLINQIINSK